MENTSSVHVYMNPDTVLQDLQDVMGMQSNKRQGEVLAMLELGLELFSSTLSQSNLALKVLINQCLCSHDFL